MTALVSAEVGNYRVHGLNIHSEFPLHERPCSSGTKPDVSFLLAERGPHEYDSEVACLAEHSLEGHTLYRLARLRSGNYVLRVRNLCDFEISADLSVVMCQVYPGVAIEWIPILLRGTVLAILLDLRGASTLHASAVEVDGKVIAVAGCSGRGKSTTAALLCAAGARLVTDDVLALHCVEHFLRCPAGSAEIRLRQPAAGLVDDGVWTESQRISLDGRLAIRPKELMNEPLPLEAVLFPTACRDFKRPTMVRIPPVEAAFRLASVPRIVGWKDNAVLHRAFDMQTALARAIPVFEISIPWVPPWDGEIAASTLDSARAALRV